MNIGVFGCSFANCSDEVQDIVWYNILAKQLNGYVYNFELNTKDKSYGEAASSLFYSYNKFLTYNTLHDLNIFVVTDPYKFTKKIKAYDNRPDIFVPGIQNCDSHLKDSNLLDTAREAIKDIKSWYIVNDDEFMLHTAELMINNMIQKTTTKTIFIGAYIDSRYNQNMKNNLCFDWGLWDLHNVQSKSLEIKASNFKESRTCMAAHFTKESNTVLSNLLFNYIKFGTKETLPSSINHENKWNYYYEQRTI